MRCDTIFGLAILLGFAPISAAQQDTTGSRPDTVWPKQEARDTSSAEAKPSVMAPVKMAIDYQIDTSHETVNLELYYYGLDGREESYDYNPWDDYLFPEGEGREEERDQRDQERDSRE